MFFLSLLGALFGAETAANNEQYKSVIEDGIRYINRNKTFLSDVHTLMFVGGSNTPSNHVYSALDEGEYLRGGRSG